MTVKRILHATDFSPASRSAFRLAQDLARALKGELILFHAYERAMPVVADGYVAPGVLEDMWAGVERDARRQLERLVAAAKARKLRVSMLLGEGPAAAAIVRAARGRRAGLVVMGTQGRTGLRRVLLGSVAERVVRTAPCPVLTVGPRA